MSKDPLDTESTNAGQRKVKKIISTQEKFEDFNTTGDDVNRLSAAALKKLNRYQRFEKKFPFYLMDVNGFTMRLRQAMVTESPDTLLRDIHTISIEGLARAFSSHDSWKELGNPGSEFVKFLKMACADDDHPELISLFKLRCIGVLWCDGSPEEKATELYDNMQDADQPEIACNDKDFKPNLFKLLDFATKMVFEIEPQFSGEPR